MATFQRLVLTVLTVAALCAVCVPSARAQVVRNLLSDIDDFKRDYHYDRPFQYSPDDPVQRGKVFRMHTGHWGRFYNCDCEEQKRNSPYICWKVHHEEDFPARRSFRQAVACDIAEVNQRVQDGACCNGCGNPYCSGSCGGNGFGNSYLDAGYGDSYYGDNDYGDNGYGYGDNGYDGGYGQNYSEQNYDGGYQQNFNEQNYNQPNYNQPNYDGGYEQNLNNPNMNGAPQNGTPRNGTELETGAGISSLRSRLNRGPRVSRFRQPQVSRSNQVDAGNKLPQSYSAGYSGGQSGLISQSPRDVIASGLRTSGRQQQASTSSTNSVVQSGGYTASRSAFEEIRGGSLSARLTSRGSDSNDSPVNGYASAGYKSEDYGYRSTRNDTSDHQSSISRSGYRLPGLNRNASTDEQPLIRTASQSQAAGGFRLNRITPDSLRR